MNNIIVSKLGRSINLIDNKAFMPMFRRRQIDYPEEYELSVKIAKQKRKPSRWFASAWSRANTSKTLRFLRNLIGKTLENINRQRAFIEQKKREKEARFKYERDTGQKAQEINRAGLEQLANIRKNLVQTLWTKHIS